jgi:DNA repair photolyase
MGVYGGLKPEDWKHWGQFTTFKTNAPELLSKALRADQVIYCSPLVDPYQPAEASERMMPRLLDVFLDRPPRTLVLQTRGPLILLDLEKLIALGRRTDLRVSFSLTTNREDIRRRYESLCAPMPERLDAVRRLNAAGIRTYATLAPLLPCDPEALLDMAIEASPHPVICDPFHTRAVKSRGATTREAALRLSARLGLDAWHNPDFQAAVVEKLRARATAAGRRFETGVAGFRLLVESVV